MERDLKQYTSTGGLLRTMLFRWLLLWICRYCAYRIKTFQRTQTRWVTVPGRVEGTREPILVVGAKVT